MFVLGCRLVTLTHNNLAPVSPVHYKKMRQQTLIHQMSTQLSQSCISHVMLRALCELCGVSAW